MKRTMIKTVLIAVMLLAAVALPGWVLTRSFLIVPAETTTRTGESTQTAARTVDMQLGPHQQESSATYLAQDLFKADIKPVTTPAAITDQPKNDTAQSFTQPVNSGKSMKPSKKSTLPVLDTPVVTTIVPSTDASVVLKVETQPPTMSVITTAAPTTTKTPTTPATPTTTAAPTTTTTVAPTTTAAPATTATTSAPTMDPEAVSHWQSEILRLTNEERVKAGLTPYKAAGSSLAKASAIRAFEISRTGSFSHTRPNGTSWYTVLGECGVSYKTAGENIAYCTAGSLTPAGVVNLWMNSSGHRANILNDKTPPFLTMGVGYYKANGKEYFVQMFIG